MGKLKTQAAEGIIWEDHGNHGVSTITNQERDKVVIGSQSTNVCRVHGGGVPNVDKVLLTCKDEGITDRVATGKVKNTHTSSILVGARACPDGSKDVGARRF